MEPNCNAFVTARGGKILQVYVDNCWLEELNLAFRGTNQPITLLRTRLRRTNPITIHLANHEHRRKWLIYLLWALLLAGILAGVWWYYSRKIDQLDRELNASSHQMSDSIELCMRSTPHSSDDAYWKRSRNAD